MTLGIREDKREMFQLKHQQILQCLKVLIKLLTVKFFFSHILEKSCLVSTKFQLSSRFVGNHSTRNVIETRPGDEVLWTQGNYLTYVDMFYSRNCTRCWAFLTQSDLR